MKLRILLLVIGIACTVAFVFIRHTYKTTPSGDVIEAEMRIGIPPSPWYKRVERDGVASSEVNPLSWSSVFGWPPWAASSHSLGCVSKSPRRCELRSPRDG